MPETKRASETPILTNPLPMWRAMSMTDQMEFGSYERFVIWINLMYRLF